MTADRTRDAGRTAWGAVRDNLVIFAVLLPFIVAAFVLEALTGIPFAWDKAFMRLDRALHLGYDPGRLLHPLLGFSIATRALDLAYYLWFPRDRGAWPIRRADGVPGRGGRRTRADCPGREVCPTD